MGIGVGVATAPEGRLAGAGVEGAGVRLPPAAQPASRRTAVEPTRSRLVGQFVVENVALTLVGGAVAGVLASLVLAAINASGVIPSARLGVNLRVLLWGLVASLVFGLLSGVVPAWRMSRLHPVEALRGRAS